MIEPRTFREAISTATVTYPIPFLIAVLMTGGLLLEGGAMTVVGVLRWVLVATGTASIAAAVILSLYATMRRPDLLRSERHVLHNRMLDIIADPETNMIIGERLGTLIASDNEQGKPKPTRRARRPTSV